jgi:hypothetical protein
VRKGITFSQKNRKGNLCPRRHDKDVETTNKALTQRILEKQINQIHKQETQRRAKWEKIGHGKYIKQNESEHSLLDSQNKEEQMFIDKTNNTTRNSNLIETTERNQPSTSSGNEETVSIRTDFNETTTSVENDPKVHNTVGGNRTVEPDQIMIPDQTAVSDHENEGINRADGEGEHTTKNGEMNRPTGPNQTNVPNQAKIRGAHKGKATKGVANHENNRTVEPGQITAPNQTIQWHCAGPR